MMATRHLFKCREFQLLRIIYRQCLSARRSCHVGCAFRNSNTHQFRSLYTYINRQNDLLNRPTIFSTMRKCQYSTEDDSMKNDPQVKSWLGEIRTDFEREQKSKNNNRKADGIANDIEVDLANVEKHGFTVEEYLAHLKENDKKLNLKEAENASSDDSGTDSDSDTDDNNPTGTKGSANSNDEGLKSDNKTMGTAFNSSELKSKTEENILTSESMVVNNESTNNFSKLSSEDWSVVVLENNYDTDEQDFETTNAKFALGTSSEAMVNNVSRESGESGSTGIGKEWSEIEIEDFVNIATQSPVVDAPWESPISLERGKTGVFDVEELVTLLRSQNARDVATIKMPVERQFADHMVIVTATSRRHLVAMAEDVKWMYKQKIGKNDAESVKLEGHETDWCAVDLGNIVLHLFLHETRRLYDLESLWTLGPELDPKMRAKEEDPYVFMEDELPWLQESERKHKEGRSK